MNRAPILFLTLLGIGASVAFFQGCQSQPDPTEVVWEATELAQIFALSPLPELPPSEGNRFADDERAAQLGQRFFFDGRFSSDNTTSCATCHEPSLFFTDGKPLAVGAQTLSRHTQGLIGCQWAKFFFWDGRADSLWAQALLPIEGEAEMASTRLNAAHVVFDHYQDAYEEIFGALPALDDHGRFPGEGRPMPGNPQHPHAVAWAQMTREDSEAINWVYVNIGKAIEAYERKLVPQPAAFDHYVAALAAGDPKGGEHISASAERGLKAFIGPAGCIHCHNGPLLSDFGFHNIGLDPVDFDRTLPREDALMRIDRGRADGAWRVLASRFRTDGRYGDAAINEELEFLMPTFEDFLGAFRTPSLRNVADTAPYGHGGQFGSLREVVDWYRELPLTPMVGHRDKVLGLFDGEVATGDLVAFLETLSGPLPKEELLSAPDTPR